MLQLVAKTCTYLLMLVVMTYNFWLIFIVSVTFAASNMGFWLVRDWAHIKKREQEQTVQYKQVVEKEQCH